MRFGARRLPAQKLINSSVVSGEWILLSGEMFFLINRGFPMSGP